MKNRPKFTGKVTHEKSLPGQNLYSLDRGWLNLDIKSQILSKHRVDPEKLSYRRNVNENLNKERSDYAEMIRENSALTLREQKIPPYSGYHVEITPARNSGPANYRT